MMLAAQRVIEKTKGWLENEMSEIEIAVEAVRIYEARHPRPTQVNQKQAAEMLGVSARTVHTLIKNGVLKLNRCGLIPVEMVDAARRVG
jgi:predicted DNA-binding protein (UPF0251 family)